MTLFLSMLCWNVDVIEFCLSKLWVTLDSIFQLNSSKHNQNTKQEKKSDIDIMDRLKNNCFSIVWQSSFKNYIKNGYESVYPTSKLRGKFYSGF